ncbi:MAG: hypothetical protein KY476_18550 [Planctomycetes bacterium]|nr:hypothetical protein [Planctomycetota bacterium]
MNLDWQTVVALICVFAATFALVRRGVRWGRGRGGGACGSGGCGTCPSEAQRSPNFVALDDVSHARRKNGAAG